MKSFTDKELCDLKGGGRWSKFDVDGDGKWDVKIRRRRDGTLVRKYRKRN